MLLVVGQGQGVERAQAARSYGHGVEVPAWAQGIQTPPPPTANLLITTLSLIVSIVASCKYVNGL